MSDELSPKLNEDEKKTLNSQLRIIRKGMSTFIDVGNALSRIREGKLYRETHKSFEAFAKYHFEYSRTYATGLANSAELISQLKEANVKELPKNEAQARILLGVANPIEVWSKSLETAKAKKRPVTANLIKNIGGKAPKPKPKKPPKPNLRAIVEEAQNELKDGNTKKVEELLAKLSKLLK